MPPTSVAVSQIRDTTLALRKALEPADDPTIFADFEFLYTNRGNKLKRGASEVEQGHLAGSRPYKKKIKYNEYSRYIIHTNLPRYDAQGRQMASSDEEDSDTDVENKEIDPYAEVDILEHLMPLTRPEDLEHHPAMSLPYKSKVLQNMCDTLEATLRAERKKLIELRNLMTTMRGDYSWIPCGDIQDGSKLHLTNGIVNGAFSSETNPSILDIDIQPEDIDRICIIDGRITLEKETNNDGLQNGLEVKAETAEVDSVPEIPQRQMTASWPLPPPPSLPATPAAEESRRLLAAIIQKQTEIVHGISQMYNNHLRAKRLKETVWRWCRAEGHVDEMSDGEDWVDLEQWGLTQPLTKGAEEGLGIGNGGDDPEYLARRAEAGANGGRGRRRGAQ